MFGNGDRAIFFILSYRRASHINWTITSMAKLGTILIYTQT